MYISKTNLNDLLRNVAYFNEDKAELGKAIRADNYDHDAVDEAKGRAWRQAQRTARLVEKIGITKPEKMAGPIGHVYFWIDLWKPDFEPTEREVMQAEFSGANVGLSDI